MQQQVGHAPPEEELAPGVEDRLPDTLHDARQLVGADMGMGLVEDFGRCAVEHERLQRLVVVAALLAAREELAVGEGSGAALAEGVVGIGVDRAVAVDLRDVALAGRDVAPSLHNDGFQPQLDKPQGGKESRRPRSDDDDLGAAPDLGIVEMHGGGLRLAVDVELEREVHLDLPLPGVDRTFDHPGQRHVGTRHTGLTRRQRSVGFGFGSLTGSEHKSYQTGHDRTILCAKIAKKALPRPNSGCVLHFFVYLCDSQCGYGVIGSHVRLRI